MNAIANTTRQTSTAPAPILVPTLNELRAELDRMDLIRSALDSESEDWDAALDACWSLLDQIADLPAWSLADLRVKAYAFDWSARLLHDEPYRNASDGEEKIMKQLVSGLLDERISL